MKSFLKKAAAALLSAILLVSASPAAVQLSLVAAAEPVSGTCGAQGGNLTWSLDADTGALTVSGTGDMADYDDESNLPPWAGYMASIRSVTIGEGVTSVGDMAFFGYQMLAQVSIGPDVTRIGEQAFTLSVLTEVYVPASVQEIGSVAFAALAMDGDNIVPTLQQITVDPANTAFSSLDGVLYNKAQTKLLEYPCGKAASSFTVPDGVTAIADMAFGYCLILQEVRLPDSLTAIGNMCFVYCFSLNSVEIAGNITTFGDMAFYSCMSLRSVVFKSGVTQIASNAFSGCDTLETVSISDSVTVIGANAFNGCQNLANLTIGSGVQTIGDYAFFGCKGITNLVIPDSVSSIGGSAFNSCTNLQNLTIGRGVQTIGSYAFSDCSNLSALTFNAVNCTEMGSMVFYGCSGLQTLSIGSGVTRIPANAFQGLETITAITIPNSVTHIGEKAFQNCSSLSDVTVGSGLASIGDYAFQNCASLTSLHIPSGVTEIGVGTFDNCENLVYICSDSADCAAKAYAEANNIEFRLCAGHSGGEANTVSGICGAQGDNAVWTLDLDTGALTVSGTGDMADFEYVWVDDDPDNAYYISETPWKEYRAAITSVTVEDGVTRVGSNAFREVEALSAVTLADSIVTIGDWAFGENAGLATVTLPDSLTVIGDGAFSSCKGLTSVTIPDRVTKIGNAAFAGTSLSGVNIPASVQNIGYFAFVCYNISQANETIPIIREINVDPANENYASENGVLLNKTKTTLLQYPCGKPDAAYSIPSTVTKLGSGAFSFALNLERVTIPDSVTIIDEECFEYCSGLTEIVIPDSVTELGAYPFIGCTSLARAVIGSGLTSICATAFYACTSLADVTIGSNVTEIGEYAFFGCTSLAKLTIPDSVSSIGAYAFHSCSSLSDLTFGRNVSTIGDWAFSGTGFSELTLPDTLTFIPSYAFAGCTNLVSIHIPTSVTEIGEYALTDCVNLSFICSDSANCYARTYAKSEGIAFRLCVGHDSDADTISGECGSEGDNVLWALNLGNGRMILSGSGDMADYASSDNTPWADRSASVQSVTVENGITSIGSYAFADCIPLTSVTIGADVTRIGEGAFESTPLSEIEIPAAVTEIGQSAFACGIRTEAGFTPTLQRVSVAPENTAFCAVNGVLFDKEQTVLILFPAANTTAAYVIPETVTAVAADAFRGAVNLTSVHVPYSVTAIGTDAFADCSALAYICCDIAGSSAETYAAENNVPFRYCNGHGAQNGVAGDANGDGTVDLKDAVLIRRYLAGGWGQITIYGLFADADANGRITLQDVTRIVRYLAGGWGVEL